MSAWIVSKNHIDYLVTAMAQYGTLDTNAHYAGQKLWKENVKSVAYRYPNDAPAERPGPVLKHGVQPSTYKHTPYKEPIEPIAVLKQIACYEYQSCEHDGWKTSWAYLVMRDLEARVLSSLPEELQTLIHSGHFNADLHPMVYSTQEFDDAPWGID